MTKLGKKIMRRVYYAFFLRGVTHPLSVHAAVILVGIFALSRAVSIPNIWANLMQVKVGEMADFFLGALSNTQFVVILWLAVVALAFLSLTLRLFKDRRLDMVMEREAEWA